MFLKLHVICIIELIPLVNKNFFQINEEKIITLIRKCKTVMNKQFWKLGSHMAGEQMKNTFQEGYLAECIKMENSHILYSALLL